MRLKNKDIAEALGISTTAVSLALNNRPGVSEVTRRKVLELLNDSTMEAMQNLKDETGSQVRSVLLNVHKKHGRIITDKPFFSDVVEAAQQEFLRQGYNMILSHYVPEQNLPQYIQYLKGLPVAGMILMATEMDEEDLAHYKEMNIPLVLMDSVFDLEDIDSVALDNETDLFRAVHFAVKMGHRRIGYFRSDVTINNFTHRMDGFLKGLRHFGLEKEDHPIVTLPCDVQGAYREMSAFLDHLPPDFQMPTIFLSDLDYIALGAMSALKDHGYRIPEDISLIGYDDVSTASVSSPPLTTLRVSQTEMGRIAANVLLSRLNRNPGRPFTLRISSEFMIRGSVKVLGNSD
jgi:LacI family transcriptional regulator